MSFTVIIRRKEDRGQELFAGFVRMGTRNRFIFRTPERRRIQSAHSACAICLLSNWQTRLHGMEIRWLNFGPEPR